MDAKTCGFCSDGFQPVRSSARFCSRKCCDAQYYQDNKERIAQYRQDNKEHIAEYKAQYRQDNKEHIAEYIAQYRQDNKERIAERNAPVTSQGEWTGD